MDPIFEVMWMTFGSSAHSIRGAKVWVTMTGDTELTASIFIRASVLS